MTFDLFYGMVKLVYQISVAILEDCCMAFPNAGERIVAYTPLAFFFNKYLYEKNIYRRNLWLV